VKHPREKTIVVALGQSVLWLKDKLIGRRTSSPSWWKRRQLLVYAKKYSLTHFIETGTYLGDTCYLMSKRNMICTSIEIDPTLAQKAQRRFASNPNVKILEGNSAVLLPSILDATKEPALIWLDGHFSGGITSSGEVESPLIEELSAILKSSVALRSVIAIDDLQDLNGDSGYASFEELQELALTNELGVRSSGSVVFLFPRLAE
jgi:hypothetical protein